MSLFFFPREFGFVFQPGAPAGNSVMFNIEVRKFLPLQVCNSRAASIAGVLFQMPLSLFAITLPPPYWTRWAHSLIFGPFGYREGDDLRRTQRARCYKGIPETGNGQSAVGDGPGYPFTGRAVECSPTRCRAKPLRLAAG